MTRTRMDRLRDARARRRIAGTCIDCGKPAAVSPAGKTMRMCRPHLDASTKRRAALKARADLKAGRANPA